MEPIVLDFQVKGVSGVTSQIDSIIKSMRDLDKVTKSATSAFDPLAKRIKGVGDAAASAATKISKYNSALAGATSSRGSGGNPNFASPPSSPSGSGSGARQQAPSLPSQFTRYVNAQKVLANAKAIGNPALIQIAQQNALRAGNAMVKAGQVAAPPVASSMKALMSSRVIMQNGAMKLMPLFNQLGGVAASGNLGNIASLASGGTGALSAIPQLAAFGPQIAIAGAAIAALGMTAKMAADAMKEIAESRLSLGTSLSGANRAFGIGGASGTNFAQIAVGIRETLRNDPIASGIARSYGVNPYSTRTGYNNDASAMAQKLLRGFLYDTNDRRAAIAAQNIPGLGEYGYARNASNNMKEQLLGAQGPNLSPSQMRQLADAQISVNLSLLKMKNLFIELGSEVLPPAAKYLEFMTNYFRVLSKLAVPPWMKWLIDRMGGGSHADDHTSAQKQNTDALKNLDRTIKQGMYGGGSDRAGRALPIGLGSAANSSAANYRLARATGATVW